MELEEQNTHSKRDELLAKVTPEILGIVWTYEGADDVAEVFPTLNYLSHGLLEQQRQSIFQKSKTLLVSKQYDQFFYLIIIEKNSSQFNEMFKQALRVVSDHTTQELDTRKKILMLGHELKNNVKSKYPMFDFIR